MRRLFKLVASVLLFALFVATPVIAEMKTPVEIAAVQYGQQRPYNWYYPYNYRYYTPHREYHSGSCYWYYTNGSYVYTCN
ncbi:MAG: hypothetical protein ACKVOH_05025 [Chlamydiales bacterium]